MSPPQIATLFEAELSRRLAGIGLEKTPVGHFRKMLAPDVFGHLGLRLFTDHDSGQTAVWPIVGVRFHQLERLICSLKGRQFHEIGSYTIGRPIGHLMESLDLAQWSVKSKAEIVDTSIEVLAAFESYGVPFMATNSTLEAAVAEMSPEELGGSHDGEHLAAAYALLAENSKALDVLDHQQARMEGGRYPDAGSFRQFADNLRCHIEASRVRRQTAPESPGSAAEA